jgi:glycosyltransferase involved in cell wall biosynthesis
MSAPTVSVVLPIYNGESFLREALDSMLSQTLRDLELILVDDFSTDNSRRIAEDYTQRDPRIKIIDNTQGKGLVGALNSGLDAATGVYIARMDADDISLPERLEKQWAFLQAHPAVSLCGTSIRSMGAAPAVDIPYPPDHATICCRMLFVNPIAHPTVLWHAETFRRFGLRYHPVSYAEDFDLWQRCADRLRLANLPEVLLLYRISSGSLTHTYREELARSVACIFRRQLARLEAPVDDETITLHRALGNEVPLERPEQLAQAREHLVFLWLANQRLALYPRAIFRATLKHYWATACKHYRGSRRLSARLYPCRELGTSSHLLESFQLFGQRLTNLARRSCAKAYRP